MRLMKQPDIVANDFMEIIFMIETSIQKNLAQKGSLGKFVFRDPKGRWFIISKLKSKYKLTYLKYGFWNYFDDVFKDKQKVYEAKDCLYEGQSGKYDQIVDNFYVSLRRIAKRCNQDSFLQYDRTENIWNMYAIPFETSSNSALNNQVVKAVVHQPKINIGTIP